MFDKFSTSLGQLADVTIIVILQGFGVAAIWVSIVCGCEI